MNYDIKNNMTRERGRSVNPIGKRITALAPTRICDIGGWTDTWFSGHGAVFNMAIFPSVETEIAVRKRASDCNIHLGLENYSLTYSFNPEDGLPGRHPLVEAVINSVIIPEGLELNINIYSAAPPGASTGTSAAVTVSLLSALEMLSSNQTSGPELARRAHRIESEKLGWQSGVQDQYSSACGGINLIEITDYPNVILSPLRPSNHFLWELEKRLLLVFIGQPHSSHQIHQRVIADLGSHSQEDIRLERMRQLAHSAKEAFCSSDIDRLGDLMNRNTDIQRQLHRDLICDSAEEVMEIASCSDVIGNKVNGAGGDGGSLTLMTDGDARKRRKLELELNRHGFRTIDIRLSMTGARVWIDQ